MASDPEDVSALYQELMAKRSSGDTKEIKALTLKLEKARKVAAQSQQSIDRYQLQGRHRALKVEATASKVWSM